MNQDPPLVEEQLKQEQVQPQTPSSSSKTWLVVAIVVVVTALVVGGVIFAWQRMTTQQQVSELQEQIQELQEPESNVSNELPISQEEVAPNSTFEAQKLGDFRAIVYTREGEHKTSFGDSDFRNLLIHVFDGEKFLPSFQLDGGYTISPFLLQDAPYVFAPQDNPQGYIVKDLTGRNLSSEYPFLEESKKNFSILNAIQVPGQDLLVVTREGSEEGADINIQNYQGEVVDTITSEVLPKGLISTRPVGWSSDKANLYLTKIGWEGYDHANLWKLNWKTKAITEVRGASEVTLGRLSVLPEKDLAVGTASKEIACDDCFGGVTDGPPTQLRLFSLNDQTFSVLYQSTKNVLTNPVLAPNGERVFYEEVVVDKDNEYITYLYSIDADGSDRRKIAEQVKIIGTSYDGERVLTVPSHLGTADVKTSQGMVYNLKDGSSYPVPMPTYTKTFNNGGSTQKMAQEVGCSYPLGYSCLYQPNQKD